MENEMSRPNLQTALAILTRMVQSDDAAIDAINVVSEKIHEMYADLHDVRNNVTTDALRRVYEAARSFLRYNGIDRAQASKAVDEMDDAIEDVKLLDGGGELEERLS